MREGPGTMGLSKRAAVLALAGLWLVALPGVALAKRVALVVGNGDYVHADPLPNPVNDARAMTAALEAVGFEVVTGIDLDRQGTLETLSRFAAALEGAEVGLFFYAGHGMQVGGVNYLVPTDARLSREADVFLSLVSLDQILQIMETEVPTRLVLLDACRDNPLARSLRRSMGATRSAAVGQGLARIDTAVGTLIAYATAPGDVAEDGTGENSPFTRALLEHIDTPGLEARQVLSRVRQSVHQETDGRQVPWDSSSLMGDFYFNLDVQVTVEAPAPSAELLFWDSIKASDDPADFQAYLDRFGEAGVFTDLARRRLAALSAPPVQPTPAADPEPTATANAELDRDTWRRVQAALQRHGLDPGGVDGLPGPRTRAALDDWRRSAGIDATAPVDTALVERLVASAPAPTPAPEPPRQASRATPEPGEAFRDCPHCPKMVVVPAGSFRMGSSPGEPGHEADEGPPLQVTIARPFAIGRHEVRRADFRAFVEATGHRSQANCKVWVVTVFVDPDKSWQSDASGTADDLPVACISVEDAEAYAAWISREAGATYRLPSEAEHYWAASGGATTPYWWGRSIDEACAYANVYDRSGRAAMPLAPWPHAGCDDGFAHLAPVASFRPNAFGLHDMSGNASEYVGDCYAASLDGHPAAGGYRKSGADCNRVPLKSGSNWASAALASTLADRWMADRRDGGFEWTGFRLVRELD